MRNIDGFFNKEEPIKYTVEIMFIIRGIGKGQRLILLGAKVKCNLRNAMASSL